MIQVFIGFFLSSRHKRDRAHRDFFSVDSVSPIINGIRDLMAHVGTMSQIYIRKRIDTNILRLFDSKVESDRKVMQDAPLLLDHLDAHEPGRPRAMPRIRQDLLETSGRLHRTTTDH